MIQPITRAVKQGMHGIFRKLLERHVQSKTHRLSDRREQRTVPAFLLQRFKAVDGNSAAAERQ